MKKILITGGSGLVGSRLTEILIEKGYHVAHLGRKEGEKRGVKTYRWDYKSGYLDVKAFDDVDYVVNLAGANVGDGRWTESRKKELYDSRVQSTGLLYETIEKNNISIKKVISASAVGYYDSAPDLMTEDKPAGKVFLAKVCADWEAEAQRFDSIHIPLCIFRIGIVLSPKGGFVAEMAKPIKLGFGAALGNGNQLISWLHIDDLCAMLLRAIENESLVGVYNAVSPEPDSNKEITKAIAKHMGKPLWLPNVPAFVLKILFGGFSYELLVNHNISARKIVNTGFEFKYPDLETTLNNVL